MSAFRKIGQMTCSSETREYLQRRAHPLLQEMVSDLVQRHAQDPSAASLSNPAEEIFSWLLRGKVSMGFAQEAFQRAVPSVRWLDDSPSCTLGPGLSFILDVGSGEMGFYNFWYDFNLKKPQMSGGTSKLSVRLADDLLQDPDGYTSHLDRIIDEFVKQYCLVPTSEAYLVGVGLTGINRTLAKTSKSQVIRVFQDIHDTMQERLNITVDFQIFAVNPSQEALFELRAVKYLLTRTCSAPAEFRGTLSAGSGSCQVTALNGDDGADLYSLQVGNATPMREKVFAEEVTDQQVCLWRERVCKEISDVKLPRGESGLFVGISAMFHAANAVGSALLSQPVAVPDVLEAFNAKIRAGGTDHKTLSNIVLCGEIISHILSSDAYIMFKRNWDSECSPCVYVSSWPLGWYVSTAGT